MQKQLKTKQDLVEEGTSFNKHIASLQNLLANTSSKTARLTILKEIIDWAIRKHKSDTVIAYVDSYINIATQINNNTEIGRRMFMNKRLCAVEWQCS